MSDPQRSRPLSAATYRRRRLSVGVLALGLLIGGVWGGGSAVTALTSELPPASIELVRPQEVRLVPANVSYPASGRSAFGATGFDGILGSSGDQGQAPIASISKIVTALVVLRDKPITGNEPGPTITFTDADVQIRARVIAQNGSNAPVYAGLQLSERQALTAMLLPSANNYAISIANWAFGSTEAFAAAAKDWLAANGLTQTRIVEPTGLSPQNVSTPADLVALGRLALADPVVASIVDDPVAELPGIGRVTNTNTLLGQGGIIGIKTGTTDEGGSCLLFASRFMVGTAEVTLFGVVLGGTSHAQIDRDVLALVRSASAAFSQTTVVAAGGELATARTAWGATTPLTAAQGLSLLAYGDQPIRVTLDATVRDGAAGQTVGRVTATTGTQSVSTDVQQATDIPGPDAWWRLTHSSR